ncbi:MAG: hypothetical protein CSYNP_01264 [Syntrophus sp. SKADARSKE-3]|nr:hypothetical protein [Syntrophus sp. SKADARSKE-3]
MFRETALTWIAELQEAGKLTDLDAEARNKLANDYAQKLEDYFNEAIVNQLKPVGKAADFERMVLYDSQYVHKYLNQMIPGYYGFRSEIFDKAKKIILGE